MFENKLEMIKSIHIECDDEVNWEEVKNRLSPLEEDGKGSRELNAIAKLESYKPSWIDKLFRKVEKQIAKLEIDMKQAIQQDKTIYEEWKRMIEIAERVCLRDTKAYLEVIEEFSPLDDLLEFGSSFEFSVEDPKSVEVEFEINTDEVVPKKIKLLTKNGKVSTKAMGKTKFYDIEQDYVCSCIIRIARDMFALLPIEEVLIHATDERLNTEKGAYEQITVISIIIDKKTLEQLNMELIDPSDAMNNFE